jgi:DNA-binding transcriptional LysR family regulator
MIDEIVSFVAVAEAGGFSEAARRLSLPKSTISHRVRQLEERLGVRLLHRTPRSVRLTDEGRLYHQRCVRILTDIEEAELAVRQDQRAPSGTLRLSAPIEFGMEVLSSVLAAFLIAHRTLRLKLELTSRNIDLVDEGFDLAVRIGRLADSSLVSRRILSIPRHLYASPAYLVEHGRPESPDELARHACLRFETAFYAGAWALDGPEGRVTMQPSGVVDANNLTVLREAAIAGLGIALLPCYQCREAERAGRLERVMPRWRPETADVYVVYPSKRHLAPKVRAFLSFLDERRDLLAQAVEDG